MPRPPASLRLSTWPAYTRTRRLVDSSAHASASEAPASTAASTARRAAPSRGVRPRNKPSTTLRKEPGPSCRSCRSCRSADGQLADAHVRLAHAGGDGLAALPAVARRDLEIAGDAVDRPERLQPVAHER